MTIALVEFKAASDKFPNGKVIGLFSDYESAYVAQEKYPDSNFKHEYNRLEVVPFYG